MAKSTFPSILKKDLWGYTVDPGMSLVDRLTQLGLVWRITLPKATINTGDSNGISFVTPATGLIYLCGFTVSKVTGGILAQFREGDTLTGGVAGTPRNLNRAWSATPDTGCPLTSPTISFTASAGGIQIFEDYLGGTAGMNRQPSPYTPDCWMPLKPSTLYSLLLTGETANSPTSAGIDLACLSIQ